MSNRRELREGDGITNVDADAGILPEPGRRPLTAPHAHRSIPSSPGKRTVTQDLRFNVATAFESSANECNEQLDRLAVAISARDFTSAFAAAASTRRSLELLHESVAAGGGGPDGTGRLNELELRAKPLLAQAPVVSDEAYRERFYSRMGAPHPLWDAEEARWTGSKKERTPEAIAQVGVSGPSAALPFHSQIQASFGRHDVSGISAHTDDGAAGAASELGAQAFAFGGHVAFAGTPDLHTAAHEAAHVVQQRAGVALAGGSASDTYEQHADEVADAVVAGRSAEGVLDRFAGQGTSAAPIVQRRGPAKTLPGPTSWEYCNTYATKILVAISDRIHAVGLPKAHPRLLWQEKEKAEYALIQALWKDVQLFEKTTLHRLMEHAYPADLYTMVDDARRGPERKEWQPEVGVVIANAFSEPLDASIKRMGMRLRVQLDGPANHVISDVHELVKTCPLDGVVETVMLTPGVIYSDFKRAPGDDTGDKPFLHGVRHLDFKWVPKEEMWNWIEVTAVSESSGHAKLTPKDATVEDVAALSLAGPESTGTTQAYRIVASPPFFGIPIETARLVPEARHHASGAGLLDADSGNFDRVADAAPLRKTPVYADAAALAQAAPPDPHDPGLDRLLQRVEDQLGVLQTRLAPWKDATAAIAGAPEFVARRRADLARDPKTAKRWTAAVAGQEKILHAVASDVVDILDELKQRKVKPDAPETPHAVRDLIAAYAHAAAVSHLAAEATPALADARRERALLPLALTEERIKAARDEVVTQRNASVGAPAEPGTDATVAAVPEMMTHVADLKLQAMRGDKLNSGEVEQLSADADEIAMRGRLATLATTIRSLKKEADEAHVSSTRSPSGSWSLQMICDMILSLIYEPEKPYSQYEEAGKLHGGWIERLDHAHKWGREPGTKNPTQWVKTAIPYINGEMATLANDLGGMKKFLKWANEEIARGRLRDLINSMALQIGIAIVTGEIAGAGLAAIRGIALAGEIASDIRGAGLLWKGAEVLAHAGLQTVASGATGGEISVQAFAENALGMVLTSAAMKPFHGLLHGSEAIEQEIRTWGQLAKKGAKVGAEVAIGTGTGVLASGVAHAVVHNTELGVASRDEWTNQGVAFAASAFVSQRTHAMHARIGQAANRFKNQTLEKLAERADALAKRADKNKHPSREEAAQMLAERHELLLAEWATYEKLGRSANDVSKRAAGDAAATGAQFADVPLELAGLSSIVDGVSYEGTAAQIKTALKNAEHFGVEIKAHQDEHTGMWTVRVGERVITIRELDFKPGAGDRPSAGSGHARIVLAGTDAELAAIAKVIKPLPNTVDVVVHGTMDDLIVEINGKEVHIDHRALATYILKSGVRIEKVRLLACKAGQHPRGVAQHLANKLGVPVVAPSDTLWIREDGELIIGPSDTRNTGKWLEFNPAKSASRYSTVPEPTKPERAIDRFHEDKARKEAEHEPTKEVGERRAELDRAAVKVGAKQGGDAIHQVEDLAMDSELQFSVGVEIGDPLFGPTLSKVLDAAVQAGHRAEVADFQKQSRRLQSRLLDALRDPTLSAEKRRVELGHVVDDAAKHFAQHATLLTGFDIQTSVARSRKAIADGVSDSFDRKMTLDDKGIVHRGRDQLGSFRSLVDKIVAANRAIAKAGIARELVISVSETRTNLREVLVLERVRDTRATSHSRGADKLPVQQGADPNAVIVDIGAGESSFGVDMLDAKDRAGAPLVQTEYGPSIVDGSRTRSDLGWEKAVPRTDDNSAVVFGDPLQTLDLMFGEHGVKRVFINNVNAHYDAAHYTKLANVLAKSMTQNGRVEVQWSDEPEFQGEPRGSRGHIAGPDLEAALKASGRPFAVEKLDPETKYDYSVKPSTRRGGADTAKNKIPSKPVPESRWIFTLH